MQRSLSIFCGVSDTVDLHNNSDKLLNHRRLFHGKNVSWNHRVQEQLHKGFHPYYAWAKARSSTPNKREDLLSLMHILSATIKVAWGAWIHDGKILKRYLWRNTSKPSWLLGKNNFIFLLGDYNLLLRKKGQFVLKVFFVKMKCTYLSKNSINVERNWFFYGWITDYIKRRVYNIIYCIANPLG